MRFVVIGLGGVGGVIAGRLALTGQQVIGIARGEHLRRIRADGLRLVTPERADHLRFPVVAAPVEIDWSDQDIVILATKSQDTAGVLHALRRAAPIRTPVVAAQNGVENERTLLRVLPNVYGMFVVLPGVHLEPGEVIGNSAPVFGQLDIGRFPAGTDHTAEELASVLRSAGFDSRAISDVRRWKYGKLRINLANAAEAICGPDHWAGPLSDRLRAEGDRVLSAAGVDYASDSELDRRRGHVLTMRPIDGLSRPGSSTWQSLTRGTGHTEVDFLNGEIALLARLSGVAAPANSTVVRILHRMAEHAEPAGSLSEATVLAEIDGYPD